MSQGFNFHVRKPTVHLHRGTHLWRCQFRNHNKPLILTLYSPHWFAGRMLQKQKETVTCNASGFVKNEWKSKMSICRYTKSKFTFQKTKITSSENPLSMPEETPGPPRDWWTLQEPPEVAQEPPRDPPGSGLFVTCKSLSPLTVVTRPCTCSIFHIIGLSGNSRKS